MATPAEVANILARISAGATFAAPLAGTGPWSIALFGVGALAGIAADVVRGQQGPVTRASDPDAWLDAMGKHWQTRKAAGK